MAGQIFKATYGSAKTKCKVFYYRGWYAVEGSVNVNRTHDEPFDGMDVEELSDFDFFTSSRPIESCDDLFDRVNE